MGTINIRIDDELKQRSYVISEQLGVTPSELLRQTLEYVAEQQKLPFKPVLLTDEDQELIELAKARLANPQHGIKVTLDSL